MRLSILISFLLFTSVSAFSQKEKVVVNDKTTFNLNWNNLNSDLPSLLFKYNSSFIAKKPRPLSPDFVYSNYGFFCKTECNIQKKALIPVKFRLGTLEYVNKLEYNR